MDPRPLTDAFRAETEPSDLQAARVHARLRASANATPARGRAWAFGAGLVAAGVPALIALAVLRAPVAPEATAPEATAPAATASIPAAPLDAVLDAAEPRALAAADGVDLRYTGFGRLSGTATAPRIEWSSGEIGVEVAPGRGLDVRVQTREARVRVVGTGFTVARDATGTAVAVSHGRVEVVCGEEPAVYLGAGESRTCLPVSAAGRLARARTLREQGVPAETVLAEARAAHATGPDAVVAGELRFLELELLVDLGRVEEARALGASLVAADTTRAPEIEALLARVGAR